MTKDAGKILKFIVDRAKEINSHDVCFNAREIQNIPDVDLVYGKLLKELKELNMLRDYIIFCGDQVRVWLTTDGLECFMERQGAKEIVENQKILFTVNGGQVNVASGNATIHATQNNGANAKELDDIIKGIMENISELKKEDADEITDVVEMAKDELIKPEPKASRLRNCLALIAPMFTIANGIPTLATNLQRLQEFISIYIG